MYQLTKEKLAELFDLIVVNNATQVEVHQWTKQVDKAHVSIAMAAMVAMLPMLLRCMSMPDATDEKKRLALVAALDAIVEDE